MALWDAAQLKCRKNFLLKISKLGDKTDEIIPKVLDAGGESCFIRLNQT